MAASSPKNIVCASSQILLFNCKGGTDDDDDDDMVGAVVSDGTDTVTDVNVLFGLIIALPLVIPNTCTVPRIIVLLIPNTNTNAVAVVPRIMIIANIITTTTMPMPSNTWRRVRVLVLSTVSSRTGPACEFKKVERSEWVSPFDKISIL